MKISSSFDSREMSEFTNQCFRRDIHVTMDFYKSTSL